jgi:hypothetical protein
MNKLILFSTLLLSSGCIMVNSTSGIKLDASLLKYRSSETAIENASSNSFSNSYTSEGGGKVDASIPLK